MKHGQNVLISTYAGESVHHSDAFTSMNLPAFAPKAVFGTGLEDNGIVSADASLQHHL